MNENDLDNTEHSNKVSISKIDISPNELRLKSFQLGGQIIESGFKPNFLIALWRGGATIGLYIQELLSYNGIVTDHIAIRTSRFTGIDVSRSEVVVHALSHVISKVKKGDSILLVDDVWDSGKTIDAFFKKMREDLMEADKLREEGGARFETLDIRVATIYYKPERNVSVNRPTYFLEETNKWLIFPHELEGLSIEEIRMKMGNEIADIMIEIKSKMSKFSTN